MAALKQAFGGQIGLGGFGEGNVVKLDGGKRMRLDDKVDFWPSTQVWCTVGIEPPVEGLGVSSMLAFLKQARADAGRPVAELAPRESARKVICSYCGKPAQLHGGRDVYPDRKDLEDRQFWVCWDCDAWVGCHRDSDLPFGELANEELRHARRAAHAAFDPVWQQGRMERPEAYAWLAGELGIPREECQIGLMGLASCRRVPDIVWERFGRLTS